MTGTRKRFGPGAMIAAAFIGPGTVTTAALAGGNFGFTLLWAVGFSVLATLLLQEMTARLGTVAQVGLGEAIAQRTGGGPFKWPAAVLVISAIVIGNAAYEAGNITGAAAGLPPLLWGETNLWGLVIGALAFTVLTTGKMQRIEAVLVLLVACMALVFVGTALALTPDLNGVFRGLFTPTIPEQSGLLILGIIGTTVVPYNLFLHASALKQRAADGFSLAAAQRDVALSIIGGGVITLCIAITAAVVLHDTGQEVRSLSQLAPTLTPLLGDASGALLTLGFFAAGLSSAITAPLAAAFAVTEVLAVQAQRRATLFRWTWRLVLGFGICVASLDLRPIELIVFAQFANGVLLPITAAFIVWICNDRGLLGEHTNSLFHNVGGLFVLAVTVALGARSVLLATGWL